MMSKGQRINDDELRERTGYLWKNKTLEEREAYKDKIKLENMNHEPVVNKERKHYNSLGQDTAVLEKEKLKKINDYQLMLSKIKAMLEEANDLGG